MRGSGGLGDDIYGLKQPVEPKQRPQETLSSCLDERLHGATSLITCTIFRYPS